MKRLARIIFAVGLVGVAAVTDNVCRAADDRCPEDTEVTRQICRSASSGDAAAQFFLGVLFEEKEKKGDAVAKGAAALWYRRSADRGYADAQNALARLYASGESVLKKDEEEAMRWARRSAAQNNPVGQYTLGSLLRHSTENSRKMEAARWLQKAAAQGNANARFELSEMVAAGEGGLVRDTQQSEILLRQAATDGSVPAQYRLATFLFQNGNHDDAVRWLRQAARYGNSDAQEHLARLLETGGANGVVNKEEALSLYRLAAEGGNIRAIVRWGRALQDDEQKDHLGAEHWLRKAADSGDREGQFYLARLLEAEGKPQRQEEAMHWYRASAAQGYPEAAFRLGCLTEGRALADPVDDARLCALAAAAGMEEAQFRLGVMYQGGYGVMQNFQQAKEWYGKAAEQGNANAQYAIGRMLEGQAEERENMLLWYEAAATQGHRSAQAMLGILYLQGREIPRDIAKAGQWLEKAAEQEQPEALFRLGIMAENGVGRVRDFTDALSLYRRSADLGYAAAQLKVGEFYYQGWGGLARDQATAAVWYRQAADQGDVLGQMFLGEMYLHGQGELPTDAAQAAFWLRPAAENGVDYAREVLCDLYEKGAPGVEKNTTEAEKWCR